MFFVPTPVREPADIMDQQEIHARNTQTAQARFERAHDSIVAVVKTRFVGQGRHETVANRRQALLVEPMQGAPHLARKDELFPWTCREGCTQPLLAQAKSVQRRGIEVSDSLRPAFIDGGQRFGVRDRLVKIAECGGAEANFSEEHARSAEFTASQHRRSLPFSGQACSAIRRHRGRCSGSRTRRAS